MSDDAGVNLQNAEEMVGVPDAYQRLWTPYRMAYLNGENKPSPQEAKSGKGCPFCAIPGRSDEDGLIVHRGEHCYVVMNLYPYAPGHVLVNPYRHFGDLTELNADEAAEFMTLTQQAMKAMRAVSNCDGINIGINQGEVAGAGIAGHLHQHVIPRFKGDSNFLPIIARTKALPQLLSEARELMANAWPKGEASV